MCWPASRAAHQSATIVSRVSTAVGAEMMRSWAWLAWRARCRSCPSRSSASAARSHSSCCRRFVVSRMGSSRLRETAEEAARTDLGELPRVADEDDLRVGAGGVVEETGPGCGCRPSRPRRPRDAAGGETAVCGVVQVDQETGDGLGGDTRGGFELGSGAGRASRRYAVAGVLPGVAGGVEREGLSGLRRGR